MSKFSETLTELMHKHDIDDEKLGEKLGVNRTTISRWRKGLRSPAMKKLPQIAKIFNVNPIIFVEESESLENSLTCIYAKLSKKNKQKVYNYAKDILTEQKQDKEQEKLTKPYSSSNINDVEISEEHHIIDYGLKSAAGVGLQNGDLFENTITVPTLPKSDYDFPITIKGDSMEPLYYDGDIAFVKSQNYLDHNEIGIFELENGTVIKKFHKVPNEIGKYDIKLISLNPKYPPITAEIQRIIGKIVK